MGEKYGIWNAYVTMHWFATGEKIIANSDDKFSRESYRWFLDIDNRIFEREEDMT